MGVLKSLLLSNKNLNFIAGILNKYLRLLWVARLEQLLQPLHGSYAPVPITQLNQIFVSMSYIFILISKIIAMLGSQLTLDQSTYL